MGRKIVCPSCNTIFDEDVLKQKNSENTCLVCGASLLDEKSQIAPKDELITWYYYSMSRGHYLSNEPLDNKDIFHLEYKFKAPNDSDKAKEILRQEYDPSAFITPPTNAKPSPEPKCPRCGCKNIQLIQQKWSILTGFRTNSVKRVCLNCKHKF